MLQPMIPIRRLLPTMALLCCGTVYPDGLPADPREPAGAAATDEATDEATGRAAELVIALEGGTFAERQRAIRELLELGESAIPALETARREGSPELRRRLGDLLQRVRQRVFDERLRELRDDPRDAAASAFPDWERFCELTSAESRPAVRRESFAWILSAEPELFRLKMFESDELPGALEQRASELAVRFHGRPDEAFPVESFAALLLLGSDPTTRLPRATSANINAALGDPRLAQLVESGARKDVLRGLLSAWFLRREINAEQPLLFTMQHPLEGGRVRAMRILESRSRRPEMILALFTLLAFETDAEALQRVESLLNEPAVLWPLGGRVPQTAPAGRDSAYRVQTRDVALAVACQMRGRSPRAFGMSARTAERLPFDVTSLGFASDERRAAAIAAYCRTFELPIPEPEDDR